MARTEADTAGAGATSEITPVLGLRQNLAQFSLLVLVNAFVGGMVGLERAILPLIAEREFGLTSKSVILSFIVGFGFVKAFTNLAAGRFSDVLGRKQLLVGGWIVGLPVPFILMWAPSWAWITAANFLLGVNQGLCWSTTVIMKIDLVGPQRRGLAMGLNEFAGYFAVSIAALASGYIAAGMWIQAGGIELIAATTSFAPWSAGAVLLGVGTAMVYPTLLAAIGDVAHPSWRASAVGVYRLWRDAGYAFGALLAGVISDLLGITRAIAATGALTFVSGVVVASQMSETLARRKAQGGDG